ncbi:hypothetical protein N7491_010031, partial [Penicillium cf. griseofulvum]
SLTPPNSPTNSLATVEDLKQLYKVLKKDYSQLGPDVVHLKQLLVKLIDNNNKQKENVDLESPICTTPDDFKSYRNDKEVYKYKIAELTKTSNNLDDYAKYIFVIRERINRRSDKVVLFIDIKSEGLRDILREVLYDIKAVSLIEDKLSIEQNILFYFLRELDRYTENIDSNSDYKSALFKPGCYIYTIYISTKEPRYIVFDAGEEIIENNETWLNLECRFLNYNGVKFGEAGIFLRVAKFRGLKPIESLKAFPLYYRLNYDIFFINKGKAIKVNINSRVVVDAPNYSRPLLRDIRVKDKVRIAVFDISIILIEGYKREKGKIRDIWCPANIILVEYTVSALRDVDWLPRSFDYLKIPLETKTILLLLAKTRLGIIPTVPFDDYIGKASILLRLPNLTYTSGLPGVGKTFTVKVTSEYFKLPLYSIRQTRPTIIKEDELRRLESLELNRREIKNIVTIVYALAKADFN